jgi:hypothetical protein
MIDSNTMSLVTPENAADYAAALSAADIPALVEQLASAEDKIRYPAFLLLKERSAIRADVYPFWDVFDAKLASDNSYQRSIGAMLISANARHDTAGKLRQSLPRYLALLSDPKPITVRQCAQALPEILRAKPEFAEPICDAILRVSLMDYKDTMRKLILLDFLEALLICRALHPAPALEEYFFSVLSGSILDYKSKKQLRARLSI